MTNAHLVELIDASTARVRLQRPGRLGLRPDDRPQPRRRRQAEQGDRGPLPQVQGRARSSARRQGRRRRTRSRSATRRSPAESIVVATGVRPRRLPGAEFDGKTIISYKEAMSLPKQPKSMLIIGGGPIGWSSATSTTRSAPRSPSSRCSTASCPVEDEEVSAALEKSLRPSAASNILTRSKTGKVEKTANGVKVEIETPGGQDDRRGRRDARGHRRDRQRRGAVRRLGEGRDLQEPHQGRPEERLRRPASRASTPSAT